VKGNVAVAQATRDEAVLPERVQEALGQLVGAAKEGLLALSVGVGLGVLTELMEEEVDDVVGLKGRWNPERTAVRHGHEAGEVTLGGRRVGVERPRVRTADGGSEVVLSTYEHFADRDPLARVVLERMLAGVSTRRYPRTQEPVGEEVEANARSLSDLVERGLDPEQGMLFVLDGSKALRKAVRTVFGEVPVQRCLWHKERNVMGHLPERDRAQVKARMRRAWRETDYQRALEQLQQLAGELDHTHPGAAATQREGMEETLTVIKLGIKSNLRRTLESTNACESMIDTVRRTQRNVKNWSSGEMGLRWTAAGMLEAEKQFRKVIGYTDLPRLAVAIERQLHLHQHNPLPTQETARAVTV
jgi:hypothetical protein